MALTYKCVICNKQIKNPNAGMKTCGDMACRHRYKTFSQNVYKQLKKKIGKKIIIWDEPRLRTIKRKNNEV